MNDAARHRDRPLVSLFTSHWLAMLGLGLVLTALATWGFLMPVRLRTGEENPYIGLATLVVPIVLIAGLVITPIGVWLGRDRLRQRLADGTFDRRVALRRLLIFIAVTALINVYVGTQVTYSAVHHMETPQFCGSCHVMEPHIAAQDGPHAALLCVDCHVGSGAGGWIDSKVQGTRQLFHVLTDNVPRPIPSALQSGRALTSRETCERCHSRDKPGGVHLEILRTYLDDEENTPETTVLTMHVGGSRMGGIHGAHYGKGVEIRFVAADPLRQDIPLVEYVNEATGATRTYLRDGEEAAAWADAPRITMQCIDCHNRVGHTFHPPAQALDQAISLGRVSRTLPYLKAKGVELLEAPYDDRAAALQAIPAALADFYRSEHPETFAARQADIREAGEVLASLYARNVFPAMKVDWQTYPDNLGHERFPGCYRCHEGEHSTATGETITAQCSACHAAPAMSETEPEILDTLGLSAPLRAMGKD